MSKTPINFKRVAAAFDEAVRGRPPCGSSSGSEYWPQSGTDLSDLVNSFMEKGSHIIHDDDIVDFENTKDDSDVDDDFVSVDDNVKNDDDNDAERKEVLRDLLLKCGSYGNGRNKYGAKQKIFQEIEVALKLIIGDNYSTGNSSSKSTELKRSLMAHLRDQGFDAGLCKSRWEKTGRSPAGTYEYIDVNVGQARYIVEVFMAGQFEIARPTARYTALLEMIPSILIIEKPQVLKQILRLMSNAMKESLRHVKMHVPPWRRNGYMQAKYLSPYKRTINKERGANNAYRAKLGLEKNKSTIGFESDVLFRVSSYSYCRGDDGFGSKVGVRTGLLSTMLQGK